MTVTSYWTHTQHKKLKFSEMVLSSVVKVKLSTFRGIFLCKFIAWTACALSVWPPWTIHHYTLTVSYNDMDVQLGLWRVSFLSQSCKACVMTTTDTQVKCLNLVNWMKGINESIDGLQCSLQERQSSGRVIPRGRRWWTWGARICWGKCGTVKLQFIALFDIKTNSRTSYHDCYGWLPLLIACC